MFGRSTKNLAVSFRQLGTMLGAGLPLTQALDTLATGPQGGWRSVFAQAEEEVRHGRSLSDGMRPASRRLGTTVMGLLEAGDRVGHQDEACFWIAEFLEQRVRTRRELISELLYPTVVVVVGLLAAPLPRLVTDGLGAYLGAVIPPLGGFVALIVAIPLVRHWAALGGVSQGLDRFLVALPVVRKIVASDSLARLSRGLALGYKAGLPLPDSLEIAAECVGNQHIRARFLRFVRSRGTSQNVVSDGLAVLPMVPPMAIQMARTGETTGDLDTMLVKLADYLEEENRHRRARAIKLFAVAVYLLVALWVAVQVIGFWGRFYGSVTAGV